MRFKTPVFLGLIALPIISHSITRVTEAAAVEWQPLFDGTSLANWTVYRNSFAYQQSRWMFWRQQSEHAGWEIDADGHLCRTQFGGDLRTVQEFKDFELRLQWRIAPAGNSGIILRAQEDPRGNSGFEMQVLDNDGHDDGKSPLTSAGALYGLYPAPDDVIVRPAEHWNSVHVIVQGSLVMFSLNGKQTVTAEIDSPDWRARLQTAPQRKRISPDFARAEKGYIVLQDHFDNVCYRDIKIRHLTQDAG